MDYFVAPNLNKNVWPCIRVWVRYLEGWADLDVLTALHRGNLTDQETGDSWVLVHNTVHSPAHLDQGDHTGWGVSHWSYKEQMRWYYLFLFVNKNSTTDSILKVEINYSKYQDN